MTDPIARAGRTWMIDLDGVLWLGEKPIVGAAQAVNELRDRGVRVLFFTNNSFVSRVEQLAKFTTHGLDVDDGDLFSSSQAAAGLLEPGERAFVLGGEGIEEALAARGVEIVGTSEGVDVVVVGLDRKLTFERLSVAVRALAAGARLVATNDDATYPSSDGPLPGGGSILAAVTYASRVTPVIAGKPYPVAAELVNSRVGAVDLMVGDRPETDGAFGIALGAKFALVRSGVTPPGVTPGDPKATYDAADLAALVAQLG